jgi:hypothetical protein
LEIVFFLVATFAAFLMFLRAAAFCFAVAIGISEKQGSQPREAF